MDFSDGVTVWQAGLVFTLSNAKFEEENIAIIIAKFS